jgi:hypothetical protein
VLVWNHSSTASSPLDAPRDPKTWANIESRPVPAWHLDEEALSKPGIVEHARKLGVKLPPQLDDPAAEVTPQLTIEVLRDVARHYFPLLAPDGRGNAV